VAAAKPQTGWWVKIQNIPEYPDKLFLLNHHPAASRHPSWSGEAIAYLNV
jgi:hypothetical protein